MRTVTIGETERRIERFSGRKVNRTLRLLKAIAKAVPDILDQRAEFVRQYEANNYIELDRAQAMVRYGAPVAITTATGELIRDEHGRLETTPSPITLMTEEAWAETGHKLRLPKAPSDMEIAWALFPEVFEKAEDLVLRLLALVVMPNADVKRYARDGSLDDKLAEEGEELLDDAMGDELLELAATAAEVVDQQLLAKARTLQESGRLGKLGAIFGMAPTPATATPTTPEQTQSSSSDSAEPASEEEPSST